MPAMQFVMYGTILSILWFGGELIHAGGMEVGELTRIFKLCPPDPELPYDDLQCVSDDDPFCGFRGPDHGGD